MKTMKKSYQIAMQCRQGGAILVFCLVFLAILTVMGTAGMETTILEERMSSNMRDHNLAFQSAESALKNAEAWLATQTLLPTASGDGSTRVWTEGGMDPSASDGKYWWNHASIDAGWWAARANAITGIDGVASQPSWVIEEYRTVNSGNSLAIGSGEQVRCRIFHRITARGVGVNETTAIRVQSTFVQSCNGSQQFQSKT